MFEDDARWEYLKDLHSKTGNPITSFQLEEKVYNKAYHDKCDEETAIENMIKYYEGICAARGIMVD